MSPDTALLVWDGEGTCDMERPQIVRTTTAGVRDACEGAPPGQIYGCFGYRAGVPMIWLANDAPPVKQQDAYAHELAHWLMDCGEYGGPTDDHANPAFHNVWGLILDAAGI